MKRFLKGIFYRICLACERVFPTDRGHVLMYHSFNLMEVFFNVSFNDFKQQIQFLQDHHYHIVSLSEFLDRKEAGLSLKKYVAITCDDGYVDFEQIAKFLHEKNIPVTLFWPCGIANDLLKLSNGAEYKIFSREGVQDVLQKFSNVTLGSHGVTHRELTKISSGDMEGELKESFVQIKNFPQSIPVVAYPRGKYNQKVLEATKSVGYRAGFTTHEGGVTNNTSPFEIPRLTADSTVDTTAFAGKLTHLYSRYVSLKS